MSVILNRQNWVFNTLKSTPYLVNLLGPHWEVYPGLADRDARMPYTVFAFKGDDAKSVLQTVFLYVDFWEDNTNCNLISQAIDYVKNMWSYTGFCFDGITAGIIRLVKDPDDIATDASNVWHKSVVFQMTYYDVDKAAAEMARSY